MEFTKTILDALKHWVNSRFSNIEKALEGKQPSGDYALKSEIPSLEGIATEEYVDNALAEFVPGEEAFVQSDWNQTDETASDYVKNRTHYAEENLVTCFENDALEFTEGAFDYPWAWIDEAMSSQGEIVKITLDGILYERQVTFDEDLDSLIAGNKKFVGGEDTGEPFIFMAGACFLAVETEGTHSVKIEKLTTTYHKLPEEYMPDSYDEFRNHTYGELVNLGDRRTDWNAEDITNPEYIKNRPFYTEHQYEEFISETTITIEFRYDCFIDSLMDFSEDTIAVMWDGVMYQCPYRDLSYNGGYRFGDQDLVEYPFYFYAQFGNGFVMGYDGEHTYSLHKVTKVVHQLDEEYIPDSIARTADVEQQIADANARFVITLDYDGTLSRTFEEITEAYTSGKELVLYVKDADFDTPDYDFTYILNTYFEFSSFMDIFVFEKIKKVGDKLGFYTIVFGPDSVVYKSFSSMSTSDDMPEQVQSDWNQNDSSASDYVKNRPMSASYPYTFGAAEAIPLGEIVQIDDFSVAGNGVLNNIKASQMQDATHNHCIEADLLHSKAELTRVMTFEKKIDTINYAMISGTQFRAFIILDTNTLTEEYKDRFTTNGMYLEDLGKVTGKYSNITLKLKKYTRLDQRYIPTTIARTSDTPTKVSQLTNDSRFQTAEEVNALINAALGVIENGTY